MPDYRRCRIPGGTYFFTVNLLERRRDLLVRHVEALRSAVRETRRRAPFHIDAWVVLPDHLHCVWTLPPGDADFSNRRRAEPWMGSAAWEPPTPGGARTAGGRCEPSGRGGSAIPGIGILPWFEAGPIPGSPTVEPVHGSTLRSH